MQRENPQPPSDYRPAPKPSYDLIKDNRTRWNSWFDAAVRALELRNAIDDFVDEQLNDYNLALSRFNTRRSQGRKPPKVPSLVHDRLTNDNWHVIARYVEVLRPCKQATMKLQGNVKTTAKRGAVKGAIWQVLPVYNEMLSAFEDSRVVTQPAVNQASQDHPSPAPSQSYTPSPQPRRTTRSSQHASTATICDNSDSNSPQDGEARASPDNKDPEQFEHAPNESQPHFSTAFNRGWQKLDYYFNLTDETPIYRVAVVLHPRMKWRWFDRYWRHHPLWISKAHEVLDELWSEYKHKPVTVVPATAAPASATIEKDEWCDYDALEDLDQMELYEREKSPAYMRDYHSPIPYWIGKLPIWPQLAQMALDIFSTPCMSDEPERVFSEAGNTMQPRRRQMHSDSMQELLCLRSWHSSGTIRLDSHAYEAAVRAAEGASIAEDMAVNTTNSNSIYGDGGDLM